MIRIILIFQYLSAGNLFGQKRLLKNWNLKVSTTYFWSHTWIKKSSRYLQLPGRFNPNVVTYIDKSGLFSWSTWEKKSESCSTLTSNLFLALYSHVHPFILIFQMNSPSQHHEPMVSMICPEKTGEKLGKLYHNQYMSADGKWTTDFDHKATCRQDKVEILEYCKKVTAQTCRALVTIWKKFRFTLFKLTNSSQWNCLTKFLILTQ